MLFADFLNYAMEQTGLTNYKLAKMIGTSQTSVANWRENGMKPRKKARAAVLDVFGVSELDLLGNEFPPISFTCEAQKEKAPAQGGEPLDPITQELIQFAETASDDERRAALEMIRLIKRQRRG